MFSPPDSPKLTTNPMTRLINSISSSDGNVMLAAVISLLLVVLFVLILHIYAKWFLAHARQRRRRSSVSVSHVLRPTRFHHFHTFTFDSSSTSDSPSKGLEPSIIASIPLFVYKMEEYKQGLECVICLSAFEDDDRGRNLPKCGHAFHVECVDMWLNSHSSCPICRAPVVGETNKVAIVNTVENGVNSVENGGELDDHEINHGESRILNIVSDVSNCDQNEYDSLSASSSSSALSSSLGCSLKRMLSRNRSERKVFPSSNVTELDA